MSVRKFSVASNSAPLLEAFIKEAKALGVEYQEHFTNLNQKQLNEKTSSSSGCLYFSNDGFRSSNTNKAMMALSYSSDSIDYGLPNDWNYAIERVKEFIKEIKAQEDLKSYTKFEGLVLGKTYEFMKKTEDEPKTAACYAGDWLYITPIKLASGISYILSNRKEVTGEQRILIATSSRLSDVSINDNNFRFKEVEK